MVLTRNQKKSQNLIEKPNQPNQHNIDDSNIIKNNHSYFTRSKDSNQNESDKNDKSKDSNQNEGDKIQDKINTKNIKKNNNKPIKQIPQGGKSGLMQIGMPISFMLFNINKSMSRFKNNKNPKCEIGINCDGCDLCNKDNNDENKVDGLQEYNDYDDYNDDCGCDYDCDCDEEYDDEEDEDEDDEELDEFFSYMNKIKILKNKIPDMKINDTLKDKLLSMLKSSNLDDKRLEWFDTLTKIPFGEYSKYDIDVNNIEHTKKYIKNIYTNLEKSVWGMNDVKEEILNYVTQCITQPDSKPRVLALCGQPGIGKTKIVRDGISKSLNREMRCFSMGGIKDSSTFFGFDYTYVGSKYGAIVQALIDCKTMNPVLFFDELDKISDTKEGQDIENFLIHLTDPVQNYDFNDKYFNGIPIDISKSLLIFSFNDMESISPILRDRLHIINIPSPSVKDKVNIASKFFVKEFLDNFKLNENEVIFENDIIKYIIDRYTGDESGVRKLRRCIETICMKINTSKLLGDCVKELNLSTSKINITLPIKLTKEQIDVFLHVKENNKNDKIPFMYI